MQPQIRHTQSASLYDLRSFQQEPKYEIPKTSPSYDSVVTRAENLTLDKFIDSKKYNSVLRTIIPDEEDWTRLCEFSDYMFDNVDGIDKQPHKTTCEQLLSHNPKMYSWLCQTAKLESKKTSDVGFQYKALSLDWSRSYFRKNLYTEIPETSFDWRKVIAPDELVTKTSEKKHQVPVRVREHKLIPTLITDKLQRKRIIAKSLDDLCNCLEKKLHTNIMKS